MARALDLAAQAGQAGDVPIGAVVIDDTGAVLGEGCNVRERDGDPTGHAEIVALRAAARRLGSSRLDGLTLVTTLEPCPMCAGAALLARIARVVYGALDPKMGAAGSVWDVLREPRATHRCEVMGGVGGDEAAAFLADFFDARRAR